MKQTLRLFLMAAMLMGALWAPPTATAQGARTAASVEEGEIPQGYLLSPAYPNPFNPRTSFTLTVREAQDVKVEVFNLLGLPVKTLFNGSLEANQPMTFTFDAGDLPSGIYLYRVQGKNFTATRQMTLLK